MDQLNNTLVSSFLNGLAGSQTYSYGTAKCGFVKKLRYIGSKNYDSRYCKTVRLHFGRISTAQNKPTFGNFTR